MALTTISVAVIVADHGSMAIDEVVKQREELESKRCRGRLLIAQLRFEFDMHTIQPTACSLAIIILITRGQVSN
jgi:hypothetical protein